VFKDGASVMKKVGKLVAAEPQLCYAYGVQLAVLDVLYNRRTSRAAVAEESESEVTQNRDDDDDALVAQHQHDGGLKLLQDTYDVIAELSGEFKQVIDKVHAVVRIFRRPPLKNDAVCKVANTYEA